FSGTGVDEGIPAPRGELLPPWPNPFNPKVTLRFDLETEAQIDLRILDIRGREVCEILNERRRAGSHELSWNGRDTQGASLPSGVYLARLRANGQILSSRKLVMIR
ncbi:MAG: FlgD immunoglobulin-like domain containing protein, partial [Candidatus Krumholzibacteria bacterium]|nr:FlgD immunoglobulin-like domain containing protein [Candidatus Krumholzibacteria bacterium]